MDRKKPHQRLGSDGEGKTKGRSQGQTRYVSVWKRKGKGSKRDGHSCMMKYKATDSNLGSQCAAHHESGRTAYIEKRKKEWITRHGPERSDWQTDWTTGVAEKMRVCAVRSAMLAAIRKGVL